jgi:hypothetical protein
MNFEEGVIKAIRSYYRGEIPEATFEQFPDMKYTPQYFAEFEEELIKEMGDEAGERLDADEVEETEEDED